MKCTSTGMASLAERIAFLEQYVSFRRHYETLDFAIDFQNNGGGMVPGPSEWDIRIVAVVPETEIAAWVAGGAITTNVEKDWLKTVPTTVDLTGVNEWYTRAQVVVGVDRAKRIVVYRNMVH